MFEDSFLDSFMESHIGGWNADTESMYDNEADENWWADREEDDSEEYDDGSYDEDDERMENADLDFDQSDY